MSAFTQSRVHIYTFGIWEKLREGGGGVGGGGGFDQNKYKATE